MDVIGRAGMRQMVLGLVTCTDNTVVWVRARGETGGRSNLAVLHERCSLGVILQPQTGVVHSLAMSGCITE